MRRLVVVAAFAAAPLVLFAQAPKNATADIQLQFGRMLMDDARYREAVDAYRRALAAPEIGRAMWRERE